MSVIVVGALLFGACKGETEKEQAQNARTIAEAVTSQTAAAAPYPGDFTATFDPSAFTTTYVVLVNLPLPAQSERDSTELHAKWSGANCGTHGIVNFIHTFQPSTDDWDFGYAREEGAAGESITYRWVHPHPPCGETPDHKDATIKVTVSNKLGSFTCTYVGAATGKGDCKSDK